MTPIGQEIIHQAILNLPDEQARGALIGLEYAASVIREKDIEAREHYRRTGNQYWHDLSCETRVMLDIIELTTYTAYSKLEGGETEGQSEGLAG